MPLSLMQNDEAIGIGIVEPFSCYGLTAILKGDLNVADIDGLLRQCCWGCRRVRRCAWGTAPACRKLQRVVGWDKCVFYCDELIVTGGRAPH